MRVQDTFHPFRDPLRGGACLPLSAIDAINPAFDHVRDQLVRRFRIGQWVRLAIVGLLAGEMGSSGGCNTNVNLPGGKFPWPIHPQSVPHTANAFLPEAWTNHPVLFGSGIAVLIVIGLALLVLLIYISSVMRFILFDSIVTKECHIRAGWARRKRPGFDLFVTFSCLGPTHHAPMGTGSSLDSRLPRQTRSTPTRMSQRPRSRSRCSSARPRCPARPSPDRRSSCARARRPAGTR